MIRRFLISRIIRTTIILFIVAIFVMFVQKNEYKLEKEVISNIEYVNSVINEQEIFLLDKNGMLSRTSVIMNEKNIEKQVKHLLDVLIIDGANSSLIKDGFNALIPKGTKINGITVSNSIAKVNFSKDFLNYNEKDEVSIIEAITYTLTSLEDISGVLIYIESEMLNILPKTKELLPEILTRSYGINKVYDITSVKNICSTTVYYISESNDEYYYVPVTKYTNDSNEKIKIIIDELSSGPIYQTNLMSFLNYNIELINYEFNENQAVLEFNNYIFDDQNTYKVLEEVAYSISLSVMDNYNVNEVIFYVDDTEVFKY